ncbi:MAG: M20 family metallopeptidase [Desulfitobacteriaceae bacterium]
MAEQKTRRVQDDLTESEEGYLPETWATYEPEFLNMLQTVWTCISKEELVSLTQELIRIPSVYRPSQVDGNETKVAEFIARYLQEEGFEVHTEEVVPGRPNVWSVFKGDGPGKTLLFEGHTDVVTEGNVEDWLYPPFEGRVEGGRIYGRGSCDTKGNLAAAILAVRAIKRSGISFAGQLILCIPVDEEGLMQGIKHFIRQGYAQGIDGAVICEPEENQLCITQKGALRILVRIHGKMAHGAMPLSGINPITRAARFIVAVDELEREEISRHGKDPFLGYPSLTPTIMLAPENAEPQINVMPAHALVALDIRTIPGQSHPEIIQMLNNRLALLKSEDPLFNAEIEVIEERPWTETPRSDPLVRSMADAYVQTTGQKPFYNGVPGATDGTLLHSWAGIPIITTGAGNRLVPHQKNEWVDIEELITACRLYAATALNFCNR